MHDWDDDNPWKPGKNFYNKSDYYQDDQEYSYDDHFCDDASCENKKHPDSECQPDQELLTKVFKSLCIIKKEIDKCDDLLINPKFGLKEIKREIRNIECAIFSPTFGLEEIKSEVSEILDIVSDINIEIPITLLNDIKSEVSAIESAVFNPTFGLEEIKSEISMIETIVGGIMTEINNPTFGLLEIKSEISQILANQGQESLFLSTGPFLLDCEEQILHLKAVNKTGTPQSVTFFIRDLSTCPPTQAGIFASGLITPCCAVFNEIDISGLSRRNIEINVARSNLGVLIYAATLSGNVNCPGRKVNDIKHAEWVPISSICLS